MSFMDRWARLSGAGDERNELDKLVEGEMADPVLDQALKNFRSSMVAWSDAAYSRPRTVASVVRHRSWRLAASCALGCVLVAGGVEGAFHVRHQKQESARIAAAARQAEQQRLVAKERAGTDDEDLLTNVDSDVSQEVPSAMEPLAQMMAEGETK